jgi:trypsin
LSELSLMQLSKPLELDGVHAAAIKLLPQDTPVVAGTPTQVAGWGLTEWNGYTSGPLLKADVPIIDWNECDRLYDTDLSIHEICAGTADGSMDACEGDEGGALVYNGTLVGVATVENSCGIARFPGRYTNAAIFTDWIVANSGLPTPTH